MSVRISCWRDSRGQRFQEYFKLQQQYAGNAESSSDPELFPIDQRTHQVCDQPGHLCCDTGDCRCAEFVEIGEHQEACYHCKAQYERQQLPRRQKSDAIADQANQRKGAHAPERISSTGFVLLTLQSDQKRQKQDDDDFDSFRREPRIEIWHGGLRHRGPIKNRPSGESVFTLGLPVTSDSVLDPAQRPGRPYLTFPGHRFDRRLPTMV